jgi:hypothetical protein
MIVIVGLKEFMPHRVSATRKYVRLIDAIPEIVSTKDEDVAYLFDHLINIFTKITCGQIIFSIKNYQL